jgi:hypothetical protein
LSPGAALATGVLLGTTISTAGRSIDQPAVYVVRGGLCTAERFRGGSGVTLDRVGNLRGVSVQSFSKVTVQALSQRRWVPQNQIGVTTVNAIQQANGNVSAAPTPSNPYHAILSGISPQMAELLFNPTVLNPNPRP